MTSPEQARQVALVRIAINDPEFCKARQASGNADSTVTYHMVDNPLDARFAAVSFGSAGLRIFDIRDPLHPSEVAYFNHGELNHAGVSHYDAARGLLYVPGGTGFWVLQIERQVRARLDI